jgi:hypothetical protein
MRNSTTWTRNLEEKISKDRDSGLGRNKNLENEKLDKLKKTQWQSSVD